MRTATMGLSVLDVRYVIANSEFQLSEVNRQQRPS